MHHFLQNADSIPIISFYLAYICLSFRWDEQKTLTVCARRINLSRPQQEINNYLICLSVCQCVSASFCLSMYVCVPVCLHNFLYHWTIEWCGKLTIILLISSLGLTECLWQEEISGYLWKSPTYWGSVHICMSYWILCWMECVVVVLVSILYVKVWTWFSVYKPTDVDQSVFLPC